MISSCEYTLAMILPKANSILCLTESMCASLPRVSLHKWQRHAKQIVDWIWATWQVRGVVLDFVYTTSQTSLAFIEIVGEYPDTHGCSLVPLEQFDSDHQILDDQTHVILNSICRGEATQRGPFSRVGWFAEARTWVDDVLGSAGSPSEYEIDQLNASGTFALVRFADPGKFSVWLKAVGPPNEHEFSITCVLNSFAMEHIPTILATRQEWRAWLMKESGQDLIPENDQQIHLAVRTLAHLQKASIPHLSTLKLAGCSDQSVPMLRESVSAIVEHLEEAMARQTSTKVPRLGRERLQEIGSILRSVCDQMSSLRIPNTLLHNDMNPGNILIDKGSCYFTDWAEGQIGNPFLTFQQMMIHLLKADYVGARLRRFQRLFSRCWHDHIDESHSEQAFQLAAPLSILSYLYGRGDQLQSRLCGDDQSQSYSRSLARHLDRAVSSPELLRLI